MLSSQALIKDIATGCRGRSAIVSGDTRHGLLRAYGAAFEVRQRIAPNKIDGTLDVRDFIIRVTSWVTSEESVLPANEGTAIKTRENVIVTSFPVYVGQHYRIDNL